MIRMLGSMLSIASLMIREEIASPLGSFHVLDNISQVNNGHW
jgi:hypothetical protein